MNKEIEREIKDLQKELAEVERNQAALRLQPCRGDADMREKDAKIEGLLERAEIIRNMIRNLTRKRQLMISKSTQEDREPPKSTAVPGKK
jgi:hypothetical protein